MSFFGWIFAQNASLFLSAGHWLPTEAYILHSKINKGHRGGPDSTWIEYRYVVGSRTYVSDRIDFGEWSYGDVPAYIRNFPVGTAVTAYFNPDDPEEGVLKKSGSLVGNLLLCLLAWGIGVLTIYYRFFKLVKV